MAIKGSLQEASLADVCQLLAMGNKTGCLSVTDRSNFGQIYFERGRLIFAHVVNRRDRLGDLLVRDDVLDHGQLDAVVEQQGREPERRLGELLLERELITADQLESYIRVQIEEAVYYLFTWSRGSFYFEVDERPDEDEMLVSINPESLLLEGARRVDEWSQIEKRVPSLDLLFEVERDRLRDSEVELTDPQERIIPVLDGTRTVQEIVEETGRVEFEVGKALYGLIQAGFAHRVGRREEAATNGRGPESSAEERSNLAIAFYRTDMMEDAAREFGRVLELRAGDTGARFHLALIALRRGEMVDAVRRLKQLLEDIGPRYGAFVNLAFGLQRLGRADDALLVLDEAEALRPDAADPPLLRAEIRLEAGEPRRASDCLATYRDRLDDGAVPPARFFHRAALAAAMDGGLERARTLTEEGLDAHPDSAPLLLLGGVLAERAGERTDAARRYRSAVDADPALRHGHKMLGDLIYRGGEHEEALEHYERVVELGPDSGTDVYAKIGNIHYKQRRHEHAVECWRRALELDPDNELVRANLEVVRHAVG